MSVGGYSVVGQASLRADQRETATGHADGFYGWVTDLVHQHRARLIRVVRREGVRADDALDCVQEAFLSFFNLPQARLLVGMNDDSARMLVILARNIARNRRRRHDYVRPHIVDDATTEGLASDTTSADEIIAIAEQRAMTLGCMVTLNDVQRAIVQLRVIDDIPGENIARQLGMTPSHVAVQLFRAKQKLRLCVDGMELRPVTQVEVKPMSSEKQGIALLATRSLGKAVG
jgi:RNA polymerase sigma-70 factor, ECF subfamily